MLEPPPPSDKRLEESGEGRWVGDDECIDVEEGGVEVFEVSDSSLELLLVLERDEELELLEEDELEEDELEELEELEGLGWKRNTVHDALDRA